MSAGVKSEATSRFSSEPETLMLHIRQTKRST